MVIFLVLNFLSQSIDTVRQCQKGLAVKKSLV